MPQPENATVDGIFEIEPNDDTIIIVPTVDLQELNFQQIEDGAQRVLDLLKETSVTHVIMDFRKAGSYGATALSFFVTLWRQVSRRNGRLAFCNLSDHEKEILQITNLDHLWPICSSRSEALEAVRE